MKIRKIVLGFFLVGIIYAQAPMIGTISPTSGAQGENLVVTVFGSGFVSTPTADFGAGITVTSVTYFTPSLINVNISISPTAPLGPRDVIITNPSGDADTAFAAFTVVAETDPPTATMIFPPVCNTVISCRDTFIIVRLQDENGIDDSTLQVSVNGITYTYTDPEVILLGDSLLYFMPSPWFGHGDTVDFQILRVADTFGNVATMPLTCQFFVDTMPPQLSEPVPPMGASVRDLTPVIEIPLTDDVAGVDSTSFIVRIITPEGDTLIYRWGDFSLTWRDDTLVWNASAAGLSFEEDDTMWICLSATDLVDSAGCGPNELDTCWFIYFHVPPPADVDLIVDRIYTDRFPLLSAFCLVMDEYDNTIVGLDESNFTVDEDYGSGWVNQYPIVAYLRGGGGMADIVFVVDITGSMYGMASDVVSGLHDFAESLAVAGISYRLGLVTFGDSAYFPHGYDLTGDISIFESWVSSLVFGGGGDGPECSLDAIREAVDSMHFRHGATIVIIMVTDAPPHYVGSPWEWSTSPPAPAHYTPEQVLAALLSYRAVCFIVADTGGWSWYSPPYDGVHYHMMTDSTGGQFFSWTGPGDFNLILPLIAESVRGGYMITWSSARPIGDCAMRDAKIRVELEGLTGPISDEGTRNYRAPCSPVATIVEPLPDTWTSDSLQRILMNFSEIDDSLNPNSIEFMVNGRMYTPTTSPRLTYSHPLLRWDPDPSEPFTNGQWVGVELTRVMDYQGNLPFSGPIHWHFRVDLAPPKIANRTPTPENIVTDHQPTICFDIWDDESGFNWDALLVGIDDRESRQNRPPLLVTLDINSPGVTVSGNRFCWDPSVEGYEFWDNDTVCVTILRAMDSPDYGEPNRLPDSLARWCFYIPDDDTLCPEFSDLNPDSGAQLPSGVPFTIQANITDPSGVLCAWVEYDTDGSVDDGTFMIDSLYPQGGDIFSGEIEEQSEYADFVYRVCACDADTDYGSEFDTACCCFDVIPLQFGFGPQAEIILPKPDSTSSNDDQQIVMRIYDDDVGADTNTIELEINGMIYSWGPDFAWHPDTMIFTPPPSLRFADGESVEVALTRADDLAGHHLRGTYRWKFFVDLTPPYVERTIPEPYQVVEDEDQDITFDLDDAWRRVDSSSVVIQIVDRTIGYGDAGLVWDSDEQSVRLIPENADPPIVFPNGDTICATITCTDIPPDYGAPNQMDTFELCFIFAVTSCDCRPTVVTPNGDGINDVVHFAYPRMFFGHGIIHIYDYEGEEIWRSPEGATTWDCRSETGSIVRPGLYFYSIEVDDETVCSGSITVVR
ncbi:gliding motility-associated C-terminal domain-containing protein [bacterium]|nr:gliding motility-associated C-terminal domain-containing protein [bacterium]